MSSTAWFKTGELALDEPFELTTVPVVQRKEWPVPTGQVGGSTPSGDTITVAGRTFERHALDCPECGAPMALKWSEKRRNAFYGCSRWDSTKCSGTHSAHQETGAPMGIPGNARTRYARTRAHGALDALWKSGKMSRKATYAWLQKATGLREADAHIASMDEDTALWVVKLVREAFPDVDVVDPALGGSRILTSSEEITLSMAGAEIRAERGRP